MRRRRPWKVQLDATRRSGRRRRAVNVEGVFDERSAEQCVSSRAGTSLSWNAEQTPGRSPYSAASRSTRQPRAYLFSSAKRRLATNSLRARCFRRAEQALNAATRLTARFKSDLTCREQRKSMTVETSQVPRPPAAFGLLFHRRSPEVKILGLVGSFDGWSCDRRCRYGRERHCHRFSASRAGNRAPSKTALSASFDRRTMRTITRYNEQF